MAYRLLIPRTVTVQIFYHLPDFPSILSELILQRDDVPPDFPRLFKFLDWWNKNIEARVHSVNVLVNERQSEYRATKFEIRLPNTMH
ncbi:MAG TPA: protein usg [Candidatus Paceibacterota bacterium]